MNITDYKCPAYIAGHCGFMIIVVEGDIFESKMISARESPFKTCDSFGIVYGLHSFYYRHMMPSASLHE